MGETVQQTAKLVCPNCGEVESFSLLEEWRIEDITTYFLEEDGRYSMEDVDTENKEGRVKEALCDNCGAVLDLKAVRAALGAALDDGATWPE